LEHATKGLGGKVGWWPSPSSPEKVRLRRLTPALNPFMADFDEVLDKVRDEVALE
jgi:hypothetical protein